MSFETWYDRETAVVGIDGPLEISNREQLKALVLDALERGDRHFRLDFSRAGRIDSSGLGVLVSLQKRVTAKDGTLSIAGLSEELRNLFSLTKLDRLFRIVDDGEGPSGQISRLSPPPPTPRRGANEAPRPDRPPEL